MITAKLCANPIKEKTCDKSGYSVYHCTITMSVINLISSLRKTKRTGAWSFKDIPNINKLSRK